MIIVRLSGGTGNQLFQYAAGRALSLANNVPLKLDTTIQDYLYQHGFPLLKMHFRPYSLDMFAINATLAERKEIPWWLRTYGFGRLKVMIDGFRRRLINHKGKEKSFSFDPAVLALGPDAYLDGSWQSYKYFEPYKEIIKKEFMLVVEQPAHIFELGNEIKSVHSVCLHVRRGDYVGNSFYAQLGKAYYDEALAEIARQVPVEHIYIFSDDIAWCKENLTFSHQATYVDATYAGERDSGNFWLMQQCKHFVISNGSFSWWAAWLGTYSNKKVIAPKAWFADASIDTSDLIPPQWYRI